ncbi:MAG: hypothetical protein AB7G75_21995 [Candidatus Binatia bacterium]
MAIDREVLFSLLQRNLNVPPDPQRYAWLYYDNPCGTAWAWIIYETDSQEVVGSASVFPRAVWIEGQVRRCGQVSHFSIDSRYRSLGPALLLQRATFEPVTTGALDLSYDAPPHAQGMATFQRLGMQESCYLDRYARPLRVNRRLEKFLGRNVVTACIAGLANHLLALRRGRNPVMHGVEVAEFEERFTEEFSVLDTVLGPVFPIHGRRRAEDLNWKYRDDPSYNYRVWTARRRGELVAFAIIAIDGHEARIADLFGYDDSTLCYLLEEIVDFVHKHGSIETIHALISEYASQRAILEAADFQQRERPIRIVAYTTEKSGLWATIAQPQYWFFTYGDYTT